MAEGRPSVRVSALAGTNLEALRGMIAEHLREARGRSSHTLELPCDGQLGERLSYLHRHPRISVLETATTGSGEALIVTVEMDRDTHRAYVGQQRRWGESDSEAPDDGSGGRSGGDV
mmetsp:Transcript_25734/g.81655  ORF Transcript_25734/g.81655 Transcript_25734/m.81655 type:complete len:117 (-) Transcript_25734:39-389(-)